ncbi:MAG: PKD domain-containing protein [Planctomycetaceae bacterium]|nr:PKD domain-containing protein [Planctomycetaceae bacterium]
MGEEILREFARYRHRHQWVRGLDLFLEAAFVMTVTAAGMLLVDRLAFELGLSAPHLSSRVRVWTTLLVPLGLSAAFAVASILLRPTPPARLAWQLDRASGGEERFLSALEFAAAGGGGPFAVALYKDAARVARETDPARVLPRAPVGYRWGIVLSLAVGSLLWAYPPQLYDAPTAEIDASPVRGPAPLEVFFRDASIGAIDEFLWDFGDGQSGRGEGTSHVYERPGLYTARLTLRAPGGTAEKSVSIEVLPADRAFADFRGKPLKGRGSLDVAFESLAKNAKKLTWEFGDGATSAETDPVHPYSEPGLYTVKLTVENDLGRDEKVREKYVKVAHPDEPIADFRALPREGEKPLEVYFEDLSSGQLSEWSWDFGDLRSGPERVSVERNPTHVYKTPGHYTVRLRVKGPHGEDEEVKERYILVKEPGDGGGGGGKNKPDPKPDPKLPKPKSGAGGGEGRFEGDPSARPKVHLIPEELKHHKPGTRMEEKVLNVYTNKDKATGQGPAQEIPLDQVLPQFQRAAEDAIEREQIPPAYRDHVRRYYEDLHRK